MSFITKFGCLCLLTGALFAQVRIPGPGGSGGAGGGAASFVKDTAACAPATTTNTVLACSLTSVTAADLGICQILGDGFPTGNTLTSVNDPSNGNWHIVYMDDSANTNDSGNGMAYIENMAAGSYSVTLTMASSHAIGIQCTTWKNARTSSVLDAAISQRNQQNSAVVTVNAGTAQTPSSANELAYSVLATLAQTPTAGASYTLLSGLSAQKGWAEYQALSGSPTVNCNYTNFGVADTYTDECAGFIATGNAAGTTALTGALNTFEGTNTVAPTAATMATTTKGIYGTSSGQWTCTNTHTDLTYSTSGQLSNFLTNKWVNGTNSTGSGSTGFQYATGSNGDGCSLTLGAFYNTISVGFWMRWDLANADSVSNSYSMLDITNGGGTDFANIQLQPTGTQMQMRLECKSGLSSNLIVTTATTYWVTWSATTNGGTDSIRVYDTSGTQLLSSSCAAQAGANPLNVIIIGNVGAETQTAGKNIWFDDLVVDVNGGFPILP